MKVRQFTDILADFGTGIKPSKQEHQHSWIRYRILESLVSSGPAKGSRRVQYRCSDPHCFSVQDREALVGKMQLCPKCKDKETVFILDRVALRMVQPLCINCRRTKEAKMHRKAAALVADIFNKDDTGEGKDV